MIERHLPQRKKSFHLTERLINKRTEKWENVYQHPMFNVFDEKFIHSNHEEVKMYLLQSNQASYMRKKLLTPSKDHILPPICN